MQIILALLVGGIPLMVVVATITVQLVQTIPAAHQARMDTEADFRAIRAVTAVNAAVQDAERGQRGYLITGREEYLAPYEKAKAQLPPLILDLQRATSGDAAQQQRLLKLQADVTTKMNELALTIAAMRSGGYEAAKAIVLTDVGQHSMVAIGAELTEIGEAANARLTARLESAVGATSRLTWSFVLGSIAAVLGLLAGAVMLVSTVRRATLSERMLRATIDSVREGVAAFDRRGRLRAWNAPFAAALLLGPDDLRVGAPLPEHHLAEDGVGAQLTQLAAASRATGRSALSEFTDARSAQIEIFHNPSADGGHVVTLLDVSERHRTEAALRQAQTLEAVGRMTGGVAHDFNNILTVIVGGLDLLRRALAEHRDALRRIDMMMLAADRATRLIRQLLAFARRQPLRPETVNLGPTMQEALTLIRRAVGDAISVECVTSAGLWNTTVDAAEFLAAVLNLALNSRDAMPEGGRLTIEISNAVLDDAYSAQHVEVEPGQYVLFAITDTGAGMDAPTAARAFDPFFTTKAASEGTGLGLPQVYGFVKQSGGHVKIYSEPGKGTTVKLYLPRSLTQEAAARPVASIATAGRETVLLVDDDDLVRSTVATMLRDLGYTVLEASGGAEALGMLQRGDRVDLLFTDVVMPGAISGRKLAEEARRIIPQLRVLFTSGYTENAIVHHGQLDAGVELLSKPYSSEQLGMRVRRVLDAAPKPPSAGVA
jgi:signal transduction histidine kinase/ActR/RegA family two-component response regulator